MTSVPSVWAMTTADKARLLRVRAADSGAVLRFTVEYESDTGWEREELSVFAARLERVPEVGALSPEQLERLQAEDALWQAMSIGMRLLAVGEHSPRQLVYKLTVRGIDRTVAQQAATELERAGYLDGCRAAMREAEKGLAKLWGDRRILAELRAKGHDAEAIAAAGEYLSGKDAKERCRRLIQKRRITLPEDRHGREKAIATLMRYGYGTGEIRAALQIELEDE